MTLSPLELSRGWLSRSAQTGPWVATRLSERDSTSRIEDGFERRVELKPAVKIARFAVGHAQRAADHGAIDLSFEDHALFSSRWLIPFS